MASVPQLLQDKTLPSPCPSTRPHSLVLEIIFRLSVQPGQASLTCSSQRHLFAFATANQGRLLTFPGPVRMRRIPYSGLLDMCWSKTTGP